MSWGLATLPRRHIATDGINLRVGVRLRRHGQPPIFAVLTGTNFGVL